MNPTAINPGFPALVREFFCQRLIAHGMPAPAPWRLTAIRFGSCSTSSPIAGGGPRRLVPSSRHPGLVADFARRLAVRLALPVLDVVRRVREGRPRRRWRTRRSSSVTSTVHWRWLDL